MRSTKKAIGKNLISGLEKVCQDLGKKTDTGKAQIIEILVGAIRTQAASLLNQCQRHQDTQNAALKSQIEQELAQFSAAHKQKMLELQSGCSTAFRKIGAHIQNVEAILSGSIANVASTFEAVDNRFKYVDETILDLQNYVQNCLCQGMECDDGEDEGPKYPAPLPCQTPLHITTRKTHHMLKLGRLLPLHTPTPPKIHPYPHSHPPTPFQTKTHQFLQQQCQVMVICRVTQGFMGIPG